RAVLELRGTLVHIDPGRERLRDVELVGEDSAECDLALDVGPAARCTAVGELERADRRVQRRRYGLLRVDRFRIGDGRVLDFEQVVEGAARESNRESDCD